MLRLNHYCITLIVMLMLSLAQAADSLMFIIRVDDILCRNTTVLPRSIQPFESVVAARGGKVTWAVIPHRLVEAANQDGALAQELILSAQNGHEIAMHGYNHICPICGSTNHEMYCSSTGAHVTSNLQQQLLSEGLQILDSLLSLTPVSFVPPGHAADNTTYSLLLEQGFKWISTTGTQSGYIYDSLFNVPPQSEFTWALTTGQYQTALNQALTSIKSYAAQKGVYCLLLHDYFIRSGYAGGIVLQWTGELLDSLVAYYGDQLKFKTICEVAVALTQPVTGVETVALAGNQLSLSNYPNPFNNTTTITFNLPQPAAISLTVYDLQGREIYGLGTHQPAGRHEVVWQPASAASGIYLMVIRTPDGQLTRRCLYLK